ELAQGGQTGGMGQLVCQSAVLLFRFYPGRNITGDTDHFDYGTGVCLADGPAGNFEPAAAAVPVMEFQSESGVAVFPQSVAGLCQLFGQILPLENVFQGFAAQLFGPVSEQPPGGGRGVDKTAIR